jgi:biopolymer transport protein ExbD
VARSFDSINVIPFIDIMLVLLAIVLMTATFVVQGEIEVELPRAENTSVPDDERDPLRLAIDEGEGIHWDGESVGLGGLEERLEGLSDEPPVVLTVDEGVSFGRFVAVVDRVKGRGLDRLSIRAREGR